MSISNSHLDLLLISLHPIAQRREAYIYNSRNEHFCTASFGQLHVIVSAPKETLLTATSGRPGAGDSLAAESTGTILIPRQMSPIAGDGLTLSSCMKYKPPLSESCLHAPQTSNLSSVRLAHERFEFLRQTS